MTRRAMLKKSLGGLASFALADLLQRDLLGAGPASPPHFLTHAPKVKRVILFHMAGGPSQIDLFDPKPLLKKHHGTPLPESVLQGGTFAFIPPTAKSMGSPYSFSKHGQCGAELSELLPHLGTVADDLTFLRGMQTDEFNHGTAELFYHTGFRLMGRPTLGAWLSYGLGSENADLPAYVVLNTGMPTAGEHIWSSGFLPTRHQGVKFRPAADPVLYLSDPAAMRREDRRDVISAVGDLNRMHHADVGDPEINTRIAQYEMAFRMQASVPELTDLRSEPEHILKLYGVELAKPGFARNCLLARRLVERGVRFVQVVDSEWDHHERIFTGLPKKCRETDRPVAALIKDLKQRGLLEDTLVIWGGEFGRTPLAEGKFDPAHAGRDHHRDAFTMWMAGGGVKRGYTHGGTDDFGFRPTHGAVHMHDLHATILHLLGIDHTKLTFRHQGRDFRLTDVHGHVVKEVLAT